LLDKYTVFEKSVKTIAASPEIEPSSNPQSLFTGLSSPLFLLSPLPRVTR